jgi:hypothetical protein
MRRFDKTKNMLKANILVESRYLESKGLIKEENCIEQYKYLDASNRSGLDEGNQKDQNNLALEISELSKQIVNAKSRGFNEFVEKLTDELKGKKAKLAELKSVKEVYDNYDDTADRAAQSRINQYSDEDKIDTNFEANLDNLDIFFNVNGKHQAVAKLLDIKIPNSNGELVPITYVFDIEYARDRIGADTDEDPAMGDTDSEISLNFNEEKSLLNNEARKYITYIDEKIVEKKDDYFDMIR